MMKLNNKAAKIAGIALAVAVLGTGTATAGSMITSNDVRNGSLGMRDFNDYTKGKITANGPGERGPAGPAGADGEDGTAGQNGRDGAQGPAGPQGPKGDPATVGISHWSVGGEVPAARNGLPGSVEIVAECQQEGHLAVSGGYTAGTYKGGVTTYQNRNTAGAPGTDAYGAGWLVGFTNTTDTPQTVRAWVVCAEVVEDEPVS